MHLIYHSQNKLYILSYCLLFMVFINSFLSNVCCTLIQFCTPSNFYNHICVKKCMFTGHRCIFKIMPSSYFSLCEKFYWYSFYIFWLRPENEIQSVNKFRRSQWPCGLRRRSTASRLLRLWVRIPPWAWMSVCCECCVLSGRCLCDELITHPEESYRLSCVVVCDLETS